jgi:hypothetical protein
VDEERFEDMGGCDADEDMDGCDAEVTVADRENAAEIAVLAAAVYLAARTSARIA